MNEIFQKLFDVDISKYVESRQGLSYLSWAKAWELVTKEFPTASYEIIEDEATRLPYFFGSEGYFVKTKATIDGEHWLPMLLPVLDSANNPLKQEPYEYTTKNGKKVMVKTCSAADINKAIMRCLTKNFAMFGMGLKLYLGEDLSDTSSVKSVSRPVSVPSKEYVTAEQLSEIKSLLSTEGVDESKILTLYKVESLEKLSKKQADSIKPNIDKIKAS